MNGKRLYRIDQGKMICGVCGGIAEYFNIDPSLVRLGTVILCCLAGTGIIAYIAAAIILPKKQ
ncbi:MAG: PspC domain-containing protein [Oscillospiraceae bacterium]|nr:PspC domain-containing protein [Oscillospiraceae bacterium]